MKLPVLKMCNRAAMIFAFCLLTLFSSCDNEGDNPCNNSERTTGKATLTLESFTPNDYGNEGNASDIFLTCKFSGTLDRFEKIRFILRSSAAGFNMVKALKLPADSYVDVDVAENIEVTFPQTLKDADGMPVTEGNSYFIFILGVPSPCSAVPVLIEASERLTLKDEIVVMTPKLKSPLAANEDISVDADYNLYISGGSPNTSSLFKVTPDGTVTTLSNSLSHPVGNTLDADGNLYVTNFASLDINLITPAGVTSVFVSDPRLIRGGGIVQDNDGALYNTFWPIKTIYRITAAGVEDFLTSNLLNGPVGMAYDGVHDHIFVSNFNDGKIFRITKDKAIEEVADLPATIGHLEYRENTFFATGLYEHKVFVVSRDGEILVTIGNGNQATVDGSASGASFSHPNGIGVSRDGKYIYITQLDGTLRKIIL